MKLSLFLAPLLMGCFTTSTTIREHFNVLSNEDINNILESGEKSELYYHGYDNSHNGKFVHFSPDILTRLQNLDDSSKSCVSPSSEVELSKAAIVVREITKSTNPHQDCSTGVGGLSFSKIKGSVSCEDFHKPRSPVNDDVGLIFLNSNDGARFVHGNTSVAVTAGKMVKFVGNVVHNVVVDEGSVIIAGPFNLETFELVGQCGQTCSFFGQPCPSTSPGVVCKCTSLSTITGEWTCTPEPISCAAVGCTVGQPCGSPPSDFCECTGDGGFLTICGEKIITSSPTISMQPSSEPSSKPSVHPSLSFKPSSQPSFKPSSQPSSKPSTQPSNQPSLSIHPSNEPSSNPSLSTQPSNEPSTQPSNEPSSNPSLSTQPSNEPSSKPSLSTQPSYQPSSNPSLSTQPSNKPSSNPSFSTKPTSQPSSNPSLSTQPSNHPSSRPSSQPSNQSSGGCFPADALVDVLNKDSLMPMSSLEIGDWVRSSKGYSQVFAFGYLSEVEKLTYLKFHTSSSGSSKFINISKNHLVFVGKEKEPRLASDIQVGDFLSMIDYNSKKEILSEVEHIDTIEKEGIYHPFTLDGTIVVNGVVVSSYSTEETIPPTIAVGGINIINMHQFQHIMYSPLRMLKKISIDKFYHAKDGHDESGSHHWDSTVEELTNFLNFKNKVHCDKEVGCELSNHRPFLLSIMNIILDFWFCSFFLFEVVVVESSLSFSSYPFNPVVNFGVIFFVVLIIVLHVILKNKNNK